MENINKELKLNFATLSNKYFEVVNLKEFAEEVYNDKIIINDYLGKPMNVDNNFTMMPFFDGIRTMKIKEVALSFIENKQYNEFLMFILAFSGGFDLIYKKTIFEIVLRSRSSIENIDFEEKLFLSRNSNDSEKEYLNFNEVIKLIQSGKVVSVNFYINGYRTDFDKVKTITTLTENNKDILRNVQKNNFYYNSKSKTLGCTHCNTTTSLENKVIMPRKCSCGQEIIFNNIKVLNVTLDNFTKTITECKDLEEIVAEETMNVNDKPFKITINKKGKLSLSKSSGKYLDANFVIINDITITNIDIQDVRKLVKLFNTCNCNDVKCLIEVLTNAKYIRLLIKAISYYGYVDFTSDILTFVKTLEMIDDYSKNSYKLTKKICEELINNNHSKVLTLNDINSFSLFFLFKKLDIVNKDTLETQAKGISVINNEGKISYVIDDVVKFVYYLCKEIEKHNDDDKDSIYRYLSNTVNDIKEISFIFHNTNTSFGEHAFFGDVRVIINSLERFNIDKLSSVIDLLKHFSEISLSKSVVSNIMNQIDTTLDFSILLKNIKKLDNFKIKTLMFKDNKKSNLELLSGKIDEVKINNYKYSLQDIFRFSSKAFDMMNFEEFKEMSNTLSIDKINQFVDFVNKSLVLNFLYNKNALILIFMLSDELKLDFEKIVNAAVFFDLPLRNIVDTLTSYVKVKDLIPERKFNYNRLHAEHDFLTSLAQLNNSKDVGFIDIYDINKKITLGKEEFFIISPKNTLDLIVEGTALNHCVGTYSDIIASRRECVLFFRKKENKSLYTFSVNSSLEIVEMSGKNNDAAEINLVNALEEYIRQDSDLIKEINTFYQM